MGQVGRPSGERDHPRGSIGLHCSTVSFSGFLSGAVPVNLSHARSRTAPTASGTEHSGVSVGAVF